jgi:hypothetical protein
MRHFVQYHNPDILEPYYPSNEFGIVTNKPVKNLLGETVWLVSRQGNPSQYILCEAFVVDEIDSGGGDGFKHSVTGVRGWSFRKPVVIDDKRWFEVLRRATGNFAFGLQPMNDKRVVKGLKAVAEAYGIWRSPSPKSRK